MKKLALVASAATALICAAALVAAPADAKSKKHAKKPAATTSQMAAAPGYGGYGGTGGPVHVNGGPVRSGDMCWKDEGSRTQAQFGYWMACPKK